MEDKIKFMEALIAGLKLSKPVIVSPSMSGQFSLPFLFSDPESATTRSQGFVAVAPVQTSTYKDKYPKSQVYIKFYKLQTYVGVIIMSEYPVITNSRGNVRGVS